MKKDLKQIQDLNISQNHKDIILGTLLGDATINFSASKASIKFEQGIKNKLYLEFLFELMKEYASKPEIREQKRVDSRYNKINISYFFNTITSELFLPFANIFYKKNQNNRIKIKPKFLFELLTPRALAFWICDDGQFVQRGGLTICTDSYTKKEVLFLKFILEKKFDLICTIHNKNIKKNYYRIYISSKSLLKL
jgi:hypothetical protein